MSKKLILALLIAGAAVTGANAQKLEAAKVPASIKTNFTKQFPKAEQVKWEKEDGNYEAGFKQGSDKMAATYKPDGTFMESEVTIPAKSLPASVQEYVKAHYKGAAIKEAAKITKASGEINYEAEVNKMDVLFDADGKFLKEVKD